MTKTIPLTRGKHTIVDDEDFEYLSQYNWQCNSSGYAVRHLPTAPDGTRKNILLHRELFGLFEYSREVQIDHINGNRLDNRRENLRMCSGRDNAKNRVVTYRTKSGYKGVIFHRNKWEANITCNKVYHYVGSFDNKEDAARAYDICAIELYGKFAKTNFPIENYIGDNHASQF